jgi:hypothetical protein
MNPGKDPYVLKILLGLLGLIGAAWLAAVSYIQYDNASKVKAIDKRVIACGERNDVRFVPREEFERTCATHDREVLAMNNSIGGLHVKLDRVQTNTDRIAGRLGCKDEEGV